MYKIIWHEDKCIGCGGCVAVCPENWKMREDGKSHPIKTELEELGCNKEAQQVCPVGAIEIIEE